MHENFILPLSQLIINYESSSTPPIFSFTNLVSLVSVARAHLVDLRPAVCLEGLAVAGRRDSVNLNTLE